MANVAPYRGRERTAAIRYQLSTIYRPGRLDDTFEMLMDAYEARAKAYAKSGQLMKAFADYHRVLQIVPSHAIVSYTRRRLLTHIRRDLDWRAEQVITHALERLDREGNPFAGLSELYPRLAARHQGMRAVRDQHQLLRRYMERALYEVAVSYLLDWSSEDYRLRAARFYLHSLYSAMGDYKNALKTLDALVAANPRAPLYHAKRAATYAALGRHAEAISDLTIHIDWATDDFEARHQRARAYAELGAYDPAIQDLSAIEPVILSTNAKLNFDMARFHAMKADYLPAVRRATKAIALAPQFARAYELRALAYFILAMVQPQQHGDEDQWNGCTPPAE